MYCAVAADHDGGLPEAVSGISRTGLSNFGDTCCRCYADRINQGDSTLNTWIGVKVPPMTIIQSS